MKSVVYRPPAAVRRKYIFKKVLALLGYVGMGLFVVWAAWPGLTAAPSVNPNYLSDPDFWVLTAGVLLAFAALAFLVVVEWNYRLACIDGGRLTWPFPFQRANGVRTRYVALEEIADAKLTAGPASRRGADLTLRDGTRLFLPETVFGVDYSELLQILVRYVRERSVSDPGGSPDRG